MAYVPPHKRHSTGAKGQALTINNDDRYTYAENAIHRWIPVGLDEEEQIPRSIHLQSFPVEAIKRRMGLETLKLVNGALDCAEPSQTCSEHWQYIAENVRLDLIASFQALWNEMKGQTSEEVKPALVVKPGKILFSCRDPSDMVEVTRNSPTEASLRGKRRIFYTDIHPSHMEYIKSTVVPEIGVKFQKEKDTYHVQLSDTSRHRTIISCECRVSNGASRLELYKLELNLLRHMIVDTACLEKNLDLRLMLCSRRIITTLTKEERKSITDLVGSAVLDGNVKGGLRWPFGMASSGGRFMVAGVCHTVSQTYESSSIRLKLRHADRFDYRTSTEDVRREVVVKLKRLVSALLEPKPDIDSVSNLLKEELKLVWEHLLK